MSSSVIGGIIQTTYSKMESLYFLKSTKRINAAVCASILQRTNSSSAASRDSVINDCIVLQFMTLSWDDSAWKNADSFKERFLRKLESVLLNHFLDGNLGKLSFLKAGISAFKLR